MAVVAHENSTRAIVLHAARALVSLASVVLDAAHMCRHAAPSPGTELVALFNCVVFGKLSCLVRCVFLQPPAARHPLWHALGSPEYALVSATLTAAFTASRAIRAIVVLATVLAAAVLVAVPQPRDVHADPRLHARYTKLVWDLADADVLTRRDCVHVLAKLDSALCKVRAARQQHPVDTHEGADGRGTCVVCMDAAACGALQPCGHAVLCRACASPVRATTLLCPCCRLPCFAGVKSLPHDKNQEEAEADVVWSSSSSGED